MTSKEIAAALNMTRSELAQEYRALRFVLDNSINAKHYSEAQLIKQAQVILTGRAKRAIESRKMAPTYAAELAEVEALFAAADKAAGWSN